MSQDRIDNLFASESWTSVYTAFTNVSLKAYDFDTIRESLLSYISRTYPDKFNDFIASSEFIAILDLVAYLGHSLAFRNDMNTRENFLDTAERRLSILRMAKTLGYIKTRPINARGMMKITSVSTTEDVSDNEGNSLAGVVCNWNDSNDVDWYEKFVTVLNASFNKNTKIQDPSASLIVGTIENYLYEINENPESKSLAYAFTSNVAGANRRFEAVRTVIEDDKIIEGEPLSGKNFTILNRNDNLGPASDRTGFFVTAKAGQLKSELFRYLTQVSNRTEIVNDTDVSNSDIWIQKVDSSSGTYLSSVTKVDNDTRETAIYNSLRTGNGDLVSVHTNIDNSVELRYPDGVFGNAAFGDYRVWYRVCANENFTVNSNDIADVQISIPYIGADDQKYRITLSLASTRDFAENFAAETFSSVRRIAQKAYYSQDRMVNAQDYNIYPLSLGNNVVRKVKAVNTSFAGNSRYFEMDDVTGHHSDLSITGTDGSVFLENEGGERFDYTTVDGTDPNSWSDALRLSLKFNRDHGNSTDFIRNELTKAISHPAIVNQYFYQYRDSKDIKNFRDVWNSSTAYTVGDSVRHGTAPNDKLYEAISDSNTDGLNPVEPGTNINVWQEFTTGANTFVTTEDGKFTRSSLNNLQIDLVDTNSVLPIEEGDCLYIEGQSINPSNSSRAMYYVKVKKVNSQQPGEYILDQVLTENGSIKKIIKGFRKTFNQTEIDAIKSQKIDNVNIDSFTLYYDLDSNNQWSWNIWDEDPQVTDITGKIAVFYKYEPGIRTNEAEYTAYIKGKKIVFESTDQVKFYYGNKDIVVDNETNLAERDKILINYYRPGDVESATVTTVGTDDITIGFTPIDEYADDGNGGATFKAKFKHTGADVTYDFVDENSGQVVPKSYKTYLVSPTGLQYLVDRATEIVSPTNVDDRIIGTVSGSGPTGQIFDSSVATDGELEFAVDDISKYVSSLSLVQADNEVVNSSEINVSPDMMPVTTETDAGNVGNAVGSTATVSTENLENTYGFLGKPSTDYFNTAQTTGNFIWMDQNELPTGEDYTTATVGMEGVQDTFFTLYEPTPDTFTFTYPSQTWGAIESADNVQNDVRFKQTAYGEISFSSTETITQSTLLLKKSGEFIDTAHTQLISTAGTGVTNYKVIFWTIDPGIGSLIDVFIGDGSTTVNLDNFSVKVVATVELKSSLQRRTTTYETKSAYVYDDYITKAGYMNQARVKLLTQTTDGDPYGVLDIFNSYGDVSNIVIEDYVDGSRTFERVSKIATASDNQSTDPLFPVPLNTSSDLKIWYNLTDQTWYNYVGAGWSPIVNFEYPDSNDPTCIVYDSRKYKVVEGRSYTEDEFMSFRWDHYADLEKRIDPSTSNIVDLYVLTSDYVRKVNKWIAGGFKEQIPTAPNNYELKSLMSSIEPKAAIADHISYIPVKFKYLFGSFSTPENQATFKVVKKSGTSYTDSEIKTAVSAKVNEYFALENWEFGDTFYFSELASYLHQQLGEYIASVVITPKFSTSGFTDLLSITSEPNEIFLSVTTSADVKIISAISQTELQGEEVTNYGQ